MIEILDVCKAYGTGNRVLRDINITIRDGEFVFIMGRSGSGKTTLLRLLIKEEEPSSGEIIVNGIELQRMRRRQIPRYRRNFGIVFQDFRLLMDRNVFENVAFAQRVVGASSRGIRESVPEMLKLVGLSSKYKSLPQHLSGGEQQRVAIARALVNKPEILLADEPTGNLDHQNAAGIMDLLWDINRMGTTVVVVTHSQEIVDQMGGRVITLDRGRMISDEIRDGYEDED
ncbi:MAG: cell division ATP-binding protein FtsE [Lachnospiraceae bacterium]|nr:cell division ATP-binding protein FtsE [Lachnospiraceae bacterium]MCI9105156.1 cell division ATP-binding protein FtsE [Lachnospiraceae bacterium]